MEAPPPLHSVRSSAYFYRDAPGFGRGALTGLSERELCKKDKISEAAECGPNRVQLPPS